MDAHVATLVDMGFDPRAASAALHDHGAQFEDALQFLMSNPDFLPGPLHPTASTPSQALLDYAVSVPTTVAGTYLEIEVSARGKQWSVQKKMAQFEELRGELVEAFPSELATAAPFPQAGMFGRQEDPALVESRRVYADEFFRVCAHSEQVCEYEGLLRFLEIPDHAYDGLVGRYEDDGPSVPLGRRGGGGGTEMRDFDSRSSRSNRPPPPRPRGAPKPRASARRSGGDAPAEEEPETLRVAIFGAGAVGGVIGAHLGRWVQNGANVQLTLLARGMHLQQLKMNGLWLNMPSGESFVVQESPFVSFIDGGNAEHIGVQDYVLLTLRSDQLAESTAAIEPLVGEDTAIVTLHSGLPFWLCYGWRGELENEPLGVVDPTGQLWDVLGPHRALGAVFDVNAACSKPGEVTVTSLGELVLGEPTGEPSDRIEALSELLTASGIQTHIDEDIRTALWARLQEDTVYGAIGALTLQSVGEMARESASMDLLHMAMEELQAIGAAAGVVCPLDSQDAVADIAERGAAKQPKMLRDLAMGKRPELESLCLAPKELSETLDVNAPCLDILALLLESRCAGMQRATTATPSSAAASRDGGGYSDRRRDEDRRAASHEEDSHEEEDARSEEYVSEEEGDGAGSEEYDYEPEPQPAPRRGRGPPPPRGGSRQQRAPPPPPSGYADI